MITLVKLLGNLNKSLGFCIINLAYLAILRRDLFIFLVFLRTYHMIKTGLEKLDDILGGGIKSGIITDIFGASGTGKSQLALQMMASSLLEGGTAFYQDTTGNFRPERMLEMFKPRGLDPSLLDKITVGRITNTSEQLSNISKIYESNFSLVVVDNVSDLFSFEYSKEGQMLEKTDRKSVV